MDPNLFHLDWERTFEALVAIMVLAFFVERACALVFESRWYIAWFEDRRVANPEAEAGASLSRARNWPAKEILAFGVSAVVCWIWHFDAVSMIILRDETHPIGTLVTAMVIAGGSKASVKLFQDIMGIRSAAAVERKKLKEGGAP